MSIYIVRHGEAVSPHLYHGGDESRALTNRGIEQCVQSANWLRDSVQTHSRFYALVSPYLRAQQTLDQFNKILSIDAAETCNDIIPSGSPTLAADYVQHLHQVHHQQAALIVISHMPLVSYLVDELCHQAHSILFPTAAIAVLTTESVTEGKAHFEQLYTPG